VSKFDFEKWLAGRCELLHGDEVRPLIEAAVALIRDTSHNQSGAEGCELCQLAKALSDLGVLDD